MQPSRRILLKGGVLATGLVLAPGSLNPDVRPTAAAAPIRANPFSLGVASGDPWPDGFVLWTRLAHRPEADDGLGGMGQTTRVVRWQVAEDERFRRVVRRGAVATGPESGHAIHVDVSGLRPGREYFYRFRTGRWISPVGRTRTSPHPAAMPASLAMSFASCANLEHGWFTAYRRMAEDEPEVVLHLGDYLYEYAPGFEPAKSGNVRAHLGPEIRTLADYRRRHAQYKLDADLQLLHATAPWIVTFDDHEVMDNWAGPVPRTVTAVPAFEQRRSAAMRAWWENMPVRRPSFPVGSSTAIRRHLSWGQLATFHVLDTRQYRDDQACGDGPGDCRETYAPERSILGAEQESWLAASFQSSTAVWNLLAQQVPFGRIDSSPTPDARLGMDAWDGYPACRDRVISSWQESRAANPVVLTGDVHDNIVNEVWRDWQDPDSLVAPEFVTTSITSNGDGRDAPDGRYRWADANPQMRFWNDLRGYVRTTITREEFVADYRCVPKVSVPDAPAFTRASFTVEAGSPAIHQTADAPLVSE